MSYQPPSTPGQPPYGGQPPPYGQQPQYGPPGYYPPPPQQPPDEDEQRRRSRKKKYTAAGILGAAASIATILTLFITLDQQPQPTNTSNTNDGGSGTTVANAYPVNVQSNFLNSCEANGSQSVCECSLSWFEQHVPISRFEQDETEIEQGGQPADIVSVEQACG